MGSQAAGKSEEWDGARLQIQVKGLGAASFLLRPEPGPSSYKQDEHEKNEEQALRRHRNLQIPRIQGKKKQSFSTGSGDSHKCFQPWGTQNVPGEHRPVVPGQSGEQPGCFLPGSLLCRGNKNYFYTQLVSNGAEGIDIS